MNAGRWVLLAVLAIALAADDQPALTIVEADALVRVGVLHRCRVALTGSVGSMPGTLAVALLQGDRELARADLALERCDQLRHPARVVLGPVASVDASGPGPRLVTTLTATGVRLSASRDLALPSAAQLRLQSLFERLRASGDQDPLPWLWIEQGAALAQAAPSLANTRALRALNDAVEAWLNGTRPVAAAGGSTMRALREPSDGSVQPYRMHLPTGAGPWPVALLLHRQSGTPAKERWPEPDAALLAAARGAGCALVEAYPGGDPTWSGVGPARALRALTAARSAEARLMGGPAALIGIGAGAQAAVLLAEQRPDAWSAVLLVDAAWSDPPEDGTERWIAGRHLGGTRPEHLAATPLAVAGVMPAGLRAWLTRVRAAGAVPSEGLPPITEPGCWSWLAAARSTPGPGLGVAREYLAWEPGPLGPVRIEGLAVWGEPGRVHWRPGPPPSVTTAGIARLVVPDAPRGLLVDGRRYAPPTGAPAVPSKSAGQACGPLATYADGPFTLVIGSTEHEAAAVANQDLAQAFVTAWVAHAQGAPRQVLDRDFRPEEHTGRHLVLVGNPRSNAVLRTMVADGMRLSVTWDERSVRVGDLTWPRAERRAIALAWPHPAHDGRLLVIIDGAPAWAGRGLPLAGLPDLAVGPAPGATRATLRRLFASDWR